MPHLRPSHRIVAPRPRSPGLGCSRRPRTAETLALLALVGVLSCALALALAAPGAARASDFIVFNQADDANVPLPGSLRLAIDGLNLQAEDESFIFFDIPTTQPVLLEGVLPDIERNVEIVADDIFGGTVGKLDPLETFEILRISKGTTILDGVQLRDGPVTVGIDAVEGADARLGFRYGIGNVVVFEEDIAGLGGVIKQGDGELRLLGDNTFAAGLFVEAGRVQVDEESLRADALLEADALLTFTKFDAGIDGETTTTPETYIGTVTGEGRVEKLGDHDLALTGGGFLHTGGTEIVNGSITADPSRFPGDVTLRANANLVMTLAADQIWAGDADGDGVIAKSGVGTLQIDGTLRNAGGLFVGSGGIAGAAANLPGRIELASLNSSTLEFRQAVDDSYGGVIFGDGEVTKSGAGTLTLTGDNAWTGGTTITEGRLRGTLASLPGSIAIAGATSSLELIVNGAATYADVISGSGTFVKTGDAQLQLDGAHPFFTGATRVEAGTLAISSTGSLAATSSLLVAPGATLTGDGSVGGALDVRGTLRPGDGLGTTFDAGGNVLLAAGSTLAVEVQYDAGSSSRSRLLAANQTTLGDITLDVTVDPGDYTAARTFQVVQSGSINQTGPITVAPLYAFVDVTTQVIGSALEVSVVENGANAVVYAQTQNQLEVAVALDEMLSNGLPSAIPVRRSLVAVTVDELPGVLDEMSAASLSSLFTQRLESSRRFSRAVARRFTAGRYEDSPPAPERRAPAPVRRDEKPVDRLHDDAAPAPPEPEPELPEQPEAPQAGPGALPPVSAPGSRRPELAYGSMRNTVGPEGGVGFWGDVFGVFGRVDGGAEAGDVKNRLYGLTLGVDWRLPDGRLLSRGQGLRVGAAFDYGHATPFAEDGFSRSTANLYLAGGHVSWTFERYYAGVVGHYGFMSADSERRIRFGDIDDTARGEFDGREGGVYAEAGARFGLPRSMYLQPLMGFEWTRLSQSGFSENGAPALDLEVAAADIDSLRTVVAAHLGAHMTLRGRFGIEPEIRLGYGYELGDVDRVIDARLTGAAVGGAFSSIGAETSRSELLVGAGYTMRVAEGLAIALDYDGRIGAEQSSQAIAASVYVQW